MPMTKLAHALSHNVDVGIGSVLGLLGSLGITTGTTPLPEGVPSWVGYLASLGVALAPMAIKALARWYRGEAAGDRVRAAKLRAKADRLRFDDTNWPSGGGTILASYLLEDGRVSNAADDYATARTISVTPCQIEKDADNYIQVEQTAEAQTYKYGFNYTINTAGVQQWAHTPDGFPAGRYQHRDGRFHWLRAVAMTNDARTFIDGELTPSLEQTSVTLPTINSGGVSIGYAAVTDVEYARGLIHRCAFYSQDYEAPNP